MEATKMWLRRQILGIKRSDKVRNEDVVQFVEEYRAVINSVKSRKLKWFSMCCDIKAGSEMSLGKRQTGRRRYKMLDDLMESGSYEHKNGSWRTGHCREGVTNLPYRRTPKERAFYRSPDNTVKLLN